MDKRYFSRLAQVAIVLTVGLLLPACPRNITVPNVGGSPQAAAQAAIAAANLSPGAVTQQFSATVAAGLVISQSPAAGASVRAGSSVSLVVSKGPASVEVPNVVGSVQATAEAAILASGLVVGTITETFSNTVAAGSVINQDPAATTSVPPGTAVSLTVSLGVQPVEIPNVVGVSQANAQGAIEGAGLVLGTVSEDFSETVAVGNVISQTPTAGTPVAPGSSVAIVVSLGPECDGVAVPDLSAESRFSAQNTLSISGLFLGTVTEAFDNTVPRYGIISQDPESGECVTEGSSVNIVASLGPEPISINDIEELQRIGNELAYPIDGNYELANNIDASSTASRKGGTGFTPIGTDATPFTGRFYGHDFTISGLTINLPDEDNVGLFGVAGVFDFDTLSAVIIDVNISGGSITGRNNVGALCGKFAKGVVENCHAGVPITGARSVGGLLGAAFATQVDSCSGTASVSSTLLGSNEVDAVGGLIGANGGSINQCTSSGPVSGRIGVGGLVGSNGGAILSSASSSSVTSPSSYVGGLIGINSGSVGDCQSTSDVTGGFEVGGLIGRNYSSLGVSRSRASGDVVCTLFGGAGGLIGSNLECPVSECLAEGSVSITSGFGAAGGLMGISGAAIVSDCYARGAVSGATDVGGLIGQTTLGSVSGTILRCYAANSITSTGTAGGLIAVVDPNLLPEVTGCFWDTQTSGLPESAGGGTGLTTAQMMQKANFAAADWDFAETWGIEEAASYPFLLWTTE